MPSTVHLLALPTPGELWCGREQFERCVGIIKYHKGSTAAEWKHLCYLVFDAPVVKGAENVPYEKRQAFVENVTKDAPYAAAVGIRKCEGQEHLTQLLQAVCSHGAEGLMLRQPGSRYERVRSKSLLKVKTFMDAEAKVIGHTPGKNRLQGMLGALQLEMPCSGHTFEVRVHLSHPPTHIPSDTSSHPITPSDRTAASCIRSLCLAIAVGSKRYDPSVIHDVSRRWALVSRTPSVIGSARASGGRSARS